jgi:hypothetical protein
MTEIQSLIEECIDNALANELTATTGAILNDCIGYTYQIMFRNYKEAISRVKEIFLELIRLKLIDLDEEYDDEINFFLDLLSEFIDKDFLIKDSLEIAKSSAKYYVSPHFFDSLVEICEKEIDNLHTLHDQLKNNRKELKTLIDEKMAERSEYLAGLE